MKTVTVREVQHRLRALLEEVERGQSLAVTRRGRVVARIVPAQRPRTPVEWPDFAARMRRIFPEGPPAGKAASRIIREMREGRP